MKEYEIQQVEREVLARVYCDECGKEFDKTTVDCSGWGQVNLTFGYGSKFDGESYNGDFCDKCSMKLIKTFKLIKVNGEN